MRYILIPILVCLQGCGYLMVAGRRENKLQRIEVKMNRKDVIGKIGKPNAVRAATSLAEDFNYQVDEYRLYPGWGDPISNLFYPSEYPNSYWLHYINGELRYWGRAGDFTGAPKEIIEHRIVSGDRINLK